MNEAERAHKNQLALMKAVLTGFSEATEDLWRLLQLEVRRGRGAICNAIARADGRWHELGETGAEVERTLVQALMVEWQDWFSEATQILDWQAKPYVLLVLDVDTKSGVVNAPAEVATLWRSTLSRRAAIAALRGLADELERRPELLEDADEPS